MSKTTGKRAFIAAQPAAEISAMDFAAASEAFAAARAKDGTATTEAQSDVIADLIAERADRLIGIPTTNRSQIADKVNAFLWLHGCTSEDLSDPAAQQRIAASSNEPAKCLLAIYLDLIAEQDRSAWDAAISAYEAAKAAEDAVAEAERDTDLSETWDAANAAKHRALDALLLTRAPDAIAMAEKARLAIINLHANWRGDDISDPAFVSRLLAGDTEEVFVASIYQDGLALAGRKDAIVTAEPDPFDAKQWLDEVEARTGSKLKPSDPYGNAEFDGGDIAVASAERGALHPSREHEVTRHACDRAKALNREHDAC